ncbi:MAG: hypothetical protein JXR64_11135, partial [Spirochaetales bacterium]|nr:hypothetical protein [Spirochaetales bacterium]
CSKNHRGYVYALYLANISCEYISGDILFEQIEHSVLEFFNINSESEYKQIVDELQVKFERERSHF